MRRLPLILLAVLLAIGLMIETWIYGGPRLATKLPVLALLTWVFVRVLVRGARRTGEG